MRFLVLTQYFMPEIGASQVRLAALVQQLAGLGHQVEVVTAMPNYPTGQIAEPYRYRLIASELWHDATLRRAWLYAAKGSGIARVLNYVSFAITSLMFILTVSRPDFILVETPPLTLALSGFLYRLRFPSSRLVINVADQSVDVMEELGIVRRPVLIRWLRSLERLSYSHADFVTTVTEGIVAALRNQHGLPDAKVLFLPNGVTVGEPVDEAAASALIAGLGLEGDRIALCVGTQGYVHGMDVILDAAERLADVERFVFLLVGDGSDRERLRALARKRGLPNVRFADPIPFAAVAPLYSRASLGVTTVRAIPLAASIRPVRSVACMAAGRPLLYAGAGEGARLVEAAGAGIVTPPEDGAALADAVRRLLADPAAAEAMGRRGRAYVETHLSWPANIAAWLDELQCRSGRAA